MTLACGWTICKSCMDPKKWHEQQNLLKYIGPFWLPTFDITTSFPVLAIPRQNESIPQDRIDHLHLSRHRGTNIFFHSKKKCQTKNTTNNDINSWSTLITEEQDWGPCLDPGIVVQPGRILLAKLRCTKKRAAGGWKNSTGGVSSEMSSHCHHIIIVFTVTLHICIITSWSYLSHIFIINSIQYSNLQDISAIFSTYSSYLYLLHVANKTQNQNNYIKIKSHQTDISISIYNSSR